MLLLVAAGAPLWLACTDAPPTAPGPGGFSASKAERTRTTLATVRWQALTRELVAGHAISPIVATRMFALVGVAQYGAIVAADFGGGQAQYEVRRGAAAGAAARVLSALFPDAPSRAAIAALLAAEAAAGPGNVHPQFRRGLEAGYAMGDLMNARAAADGFAIQWDGVLPTPGPGVWTGLPGVAPSGFQFPTLQPYFLTTQSQFRPLPPPTYGSPEFLTGVAAVVQAATSRDAAAVANAIFWSQANGTETTAGFWLGRAAALATAAGLDEREAAHLLALTSAALADVGIACYEAKYYYDFLRPSQHDPSIPLITGIGLPNHPAYPSGHSCLSGAAVTILSVWFPSAASALNAQLAEAGQSRVIAGIHYPFDVAAGQTLGRSVALWAMAYDDSQGLLTAVGR
ncbi:MAG: phosphatase PAP2 family protein [Gemmatirosa sp.]